MKVITLEEAGLLFLRRHYPNGNVPPQVFPIMTTHDPHCTAVPTGKATLCHCDGHIVVLDARREPHEVVMLKLREVRKHA